MHLNDTSMSSKINESFFLTGFMGTGKSYWSKIWAEEYGLASYDLDTIIETAFAMTVEEIFEKEGEEKFREIETLNLKKFENKKGFFLACGGGTPCFFDNLGWMKNAGTVIYLKASPEFILNRVMDEKEKRPLLKKVNTAELLYFIEKKLGEREKFYLEADHILDAERLIKNSLDFIFEEKDSTLTKAS